MYNLYQECYGGVQGVQLQGAGKVRPNPVLFMTKMFSENQFLKLERQVCKAMVTKGRTIGREQPTTDFTVISCDIPWQTWKNVAFVNCHIILVRFCKLAGVFLDVLFSHTQWVSVTLAISLCPSSLVSLLSLSWTFLIFDISQTAAQICYYFVVVL